MDKSINANQSEQSISILLVEDNESLTEMMQFIFQHEGYQFKCVSIIDNIIPVIEEYKPHLVMLDYRLPKVNGGELCLQIKNHPDHSNTPVIIYSAYSKELVTVGDYGCDAFIEKPFDLTELIEKINILVKKRNWI